MHNYLCLEEGMDIFISAILCLVFLALGFAVVFLRLRIWGYPFDEVWNESSVPGRWRSPIA